MTEGSDTKRDDLPYGTEYAKSGRAACKDCKNLIGKGTLRMSRLTRVLLYDNNYRQQDTW